MALYDPREFPETVSTDFTLEEFLAWVRTKPAGEEYEYCDGYDCAVAQFLKATGRAERPIVAYNFWRVDLHAPMKQHVFDRRVWNAACDENADWGGEDWTFGALAARLEAELAR